MQSGAYALSAGEGEPFPPEEEEGFPPEEGEEGFPPEEGPLPGPGSFVELTLVDVLASELSIETRAGESILHIAGRAPDGSDAGEVWLGRAEIPFGVAVWLDSGLIEPQALAALASQVGATAGDDLIDVSGVNDPVAVQGLEGDDAIIGWEEVTLVYSRGDGNDIVSLRNVPYSEPRSVLDLRGIAPEDVTVFSHSRDLLVRIAESSPGAGDGGVLRFVNGYQMERTSSPSDIRPVLNQIVFDNGQSWDHAEIWSRAEPAHCLGRRRFCRQCQCQRRIQHGPWRRHSGDR